VERAKEFPDAYRDLGTALAFDGDGRRSKRAIFRPRNAPMWPALDS
jgi:hypothetical protein